MAEKVNLIAAQTNDRPACRDKRDGKNCFDRERNSKQGINYRAFQDYRSKKMCQPCQIHWHLSLASQQLFHEANMEGE